MVSEKLKLFREVLSLRNYAPQTIKTYEKAVSSFYAFSNGSRPTQQTLYNYALYFPNYSQQVSKNHSQIKNIFRFHYGSCLFTLATNGSGLGEVAD